MSRRLFDSIAELGAQIDQAPHLLLCADFDGILTPLAEHPDEIALAPAMRRVLTSLARREGLTVTIMSGRNRTDLQAHINIPGLIYAGNHGLEISGSGFIFVEPTAAACSDEIKHLASGLARKLQSIPGAFVENKGLTLSVHHRQVAPVQCEEVRSLVHAALARTNHPFQLTVGKQVFEIRPRVDWNKGHAISWIKQQLNEPDVRVFYVGDDVTDSEACTGSSDWITIRVGEAPEGRAQYQLENPAQVQHFLEWLDAQMRHKKAYAAS